MTSQQHHRKKAKLLATIDSEKASKRQTANQFLEIKVFHASKEDMKLLTHIVVEHDPTSKKPKLFIDSTIALRVLSIRTLEAPRKDSNAK